VVDIYNSLHGLPQNDYAAAGSGCVTKIRTGQNKINDQDVTRFVFELSKSVRYGVSLADDRKSVTVRIIGIDENIVNAPADVSFSTDGANDYIYIASEILPSVSISTLSNPDRLVIDVSADAALPVSTEYGGVFVTAARSSQLDPYTTRITADLRAPCSYSRQTADGVTIIKIFAQPDFHVSFDDKSRIVIPKSAVPGQNIENIRHEDFYYDLSYSLIFDADFSGSLGLGPRKASGAYIDSFEIKTERDRTKLVISEKKILAFVVTDDDLNIYITPKLPKEAYPRIVVIDPGHGGKFHGAKGNDLQEEQVNLAISLKLLKRFEEDGRVKAYATRVTDVDLAPTINEDLLKRPRMANELADMFVSIHNNSMTSASSNGTETFYSKKNNAAVGGLNSQTLADIIQKNVVASLGSFDRGVKDGQDLVVLKNGKIPSALVEIGFVTNPAEAAKLKTDSYLERAADALFDGIIEAFERYERD
jgi:N-acetylmuramoyl-L-alanine amidase